VPSSIPAPTLPPFSFLAQGLPAVYHTEPNASAFRAIIDMVKMRSGSLMVSKESEMHGIITERDILDKLPFQVGSSRKLKVLLEIHSHHRTTQPCHNSKP
jgi:signal-transduction protein with cAMP-binding, CBS, and nucleotidyltransferase domain